MYHFVKPVKVVPVIILQNHTLCHTYQLGLNMDSDIKNEQQMWSGLHDFH